MYDVLKEVHKYNQDDLLEKYKLDLWSLVYLLIKWRYLDYTESVFSLKRKYELKYNKKEIKKGPSSDLDMNIAIEKKLKSLWYIEQNGNIVWLTVAWINILKEIDVKINWWFWKNLIINYPFIKDVIIAIVWAVAWSIATLLLKK